MKSSVIWLAVLVLGIFGTCYWTDGELKERDAESRRQDSAFAVERSILQARSAKRRLPPSRAARSQRTTLRHRQRVIPRLRPHSIACPALPHAITANGVCERELVTAFAMRLGTLGFDSRITKPTFGHLVSVVVCFCPEKEVMGVHARRIVATVADEHPVWDWTDKLRIAPSVRARGDNPPLPTELNDTVAIPPTSGPLPAPADRRGLRGSKEVRPPRVVTRHEAQYNGFPL